MLNLVDYFGGTFIIVFLASFEVIAISWVYGNDDRQLNVSPQSRARGNSLVFFVFFFRR